MAARLLERDAELETLARVASEAADGNGSIVLVHGEAGIGKTSLVGALRSQLPPETRMLVGFCDALSTPRPLGPFRDLARIVGDPLAGALVAGDRTVVAEALRDELVRKQPTVVVIEDVHWADEATLDTLRLLVRRIRPLPAVLLLTYRDDELGRNHPLTQLLGDASHSGEGHRLAVHRLTEPGVRGMLLGSALDSAEVFSLTAGNPYFVSELVASAEGSRVPATVVDAVLSRLRRLPIRYQDVVEQLAVVPTAVGRPLLGALVIDPGPALTDAEEHGLLTIRPDQVTFRHELTRRAIVDAMPVARRVELNQRVLTALEQLEAGAGQLVHHAAEAGDVDAVVRYAPMAAREATTAGAHREAVAQLERSLDHLDRYPAVQQVELLEAHAIECYNTGAADAAVISQSAAVELRRQLPDRRALGLSLRWLSRVLWFAGRRADAEQAAEQTSAVLAETGDPGLLAWALTNEAQLAALAHRRDDGARLAQRAIDLATEAGDRAALSHALNNLGVSLWTDNRRQGFAQLLEAAEVALSIDDVEDACRAYVNITWRLVEDFQLDEATTYLEEVLGLAERAEFLGFLYYVQGLRARLLLARARWAEATDAAGLALTGQPTARCVALTVLAAARIRTGSADPAPLLAEATQLARRMEELQRIGPVTAARCEAAALREDWAAIVADAEPVHAEAARLRTSAVQAELAYWLRRAGREVEVPDTDHPFALQARGDWLGAAAAWERLGAPYHQAAALADGDEPEALLQALVILDRLDAAPLALRLRSRLRRLGVPHVPRGPRPTSRTNPAGLTARQREVITLVASGLTNLEIADRLVLSARTVDRHVAEIFGKLDVSSRRQAVERARELGLVTRG